MPTSNIPTPQELAREQGPIVQRHIDLLAEKLRVTKQYGGSYSVDRHGVPCEHQKAVAAAFKERGWAVKWHDSQIEGTSVEFTKAPGPYGQVGDEYVARVKQFIADSPLVYESARDMTAWLASIEGMAAAMRLAGVEADPTRGAS